MTVAINYEAWARNAVAFIRARGLEDAFKHWSGGWPCPVDAKASVIAAAPDLLAALKEVVAISDRKHDAWDRARLAITKAQGQEVAPDGRGSSVNGGER